MPKFNSAKQPLTILFAFWLLNMRLDAQSFDWAQRFQCQTSGDYSSTSCIRVGALGGVYAAGNFFGTIDADGGPDTTLLISASSSMFDIFLVKYSSSGNLIWAKQWGGADGFDRTYSFVTDLSENLYMAGTFTGTVDFDPGPGVSSLTAAGGAMDTDNFILKLDSSGSLVWVRQFEGLFGSSYQSFTALDAGGNVYVASNFQTTVDFDPGPGTASLTSSPPGSPNFFVTRLDSSGNFVWVRHLAGSNMTPTGVDQMGSGIYFTGYFEGAADLDPGIGTYNVSALGGTDAFVLRLDTAGNFTWGNRLGSFGDDYANSIAVNTAAGVNVAGSFQLTVDFDPGAGTSTLTSSGSDDIFICRFDTAGAFVRASGMGGPMLDEAKGLTLDAAGNVYATGRYNPIADFEPGPVTFDLDGQGNDIFIIKQDAAGNVSWAKAISGPSLDNGRSLAIDSAGNVYTAGSYQDNADFDTGPGVLPFSTPGVEEGFIHRIVPCSVTESTLSVERCANYTMPSGTLTYTESGTYMDVIPNAAGCDSIITVDLSILNTEYMMSVTTCDSFVPPSGGPTHYSSGTFTDIIPNSAGCDSIIHIFLTIVSMADTSVTVADPLLTSNASGAIYQWIDCSDGSWIPGATSQNFTATSNGQYAVIVSQFGCTDTSSCFAIVMAGKDATIPLSRISIYPNPFTSSFTVELGTIHNEVNVRLWRVTGECILSRKFSNIDDFDLLLGDEPAGTYLLEIAVDAEKAYHARLMKQ